MRLSAEVQAQYAMEPECWDWKWHVTEEVQRRVCRETGFAGNVTEGLDLLRGSMALFPEDAEVKQAAHYLRYNIHVDCPLEKGVVTPDVPLYNLGGEERSLHNIVATTSATLVLAGSHT